ncbi:MAG: hypothetical protein PVG78_06355 [Desulfobacterales bacterium]|jgi:hypothetical protein
MKPSRLLLAIGLVFGATALLFAAPAEAQHGYGMHRGMWGGSPGYGPGGGWSYCPYCGSRLRDRGDDGYGYGDRGGYPMGPGMMGPGDYGRRGMGPGMTGPGYGYDRGSDYPDNPRYRHREPLKKEEAKEQVQQMLAQSRNPNLKVGDVEDKNRFFEVDILTKGGDLVDKMQVDKESGLMRSIY